MVTPSVKRRIHTISVVAAALLLCTCGEDGGRQSAAAQLPTYVVQVAAPQIGDVSEYREWIGQLYGLVSTDVQPQVRGYVKERFFENGAQVTAGQILYKIEPTLYVQALDEATQRRAQAEAAEKEAAEHLAYNEPLVRSGAISRMTYTDARQQLLSAQAALAAARAAEDQARTNLDYCTLRSPTTGLIGFAQADVGSYVSPDGRSLVQISQVDPLRVRFSISAQDWLNQGGSDGSLRPGETVELILPNGSTYEQTATIEGVDNSVSAATGALMLEARTPNPSALLRPGMFVKVRARVGGQKGVLLVPVGAIVSLQGKTMVVELDPQGAAHLVPVELGLQQQGLVAVKGELSVRSQIVVRGTQQALMAVDGRAVLRTSKQ